MKTTVLENETDVTFTVEVIGHFETSIPLQFLTEDNSASSKGNLCIHMLLNKYLTLISSV